MIRRIYKFISIILINVLLLCNFCSVCHAKDFIFAKSNIELNPIIDIPATNISKTNVDIYPRVELPSSDKVLTTPSEDVIGNKIVGDIFKAEENSNIKNATLQAESLDQSNTCKGSSNNETNDDKDDLEKYGPDKNAFDSNFDSKGSTGRTEPNNLQEKLSMDQVKSNPLEGAVKLDKIRIRDSRWPADDGWVKMQNIVEHSDGTSTNIHFNYNEITGEFDDFKFK